MDVETKLIVLRKKLLMGIVCLAIAVALVWSLILLDMVEQYATVGLFVSAFAIGYWVHFYWRYAVEFLMDPRQREDDA